MLLAFLLIVYALAFIIGTVVSTVGLALSLFVVEDDWANTYSEQGIGAVLARCALIAAVSTLFNFFPCGGLLALIIWFVGIMYFFQKTFVQTIILSLVNMAIGYAIMWGLSTLIDIARVSLEAAA
ncbi:MAG: hypothetical protein NXI22_11770 [bacterium]|nr:hypothetical protein [bacterium]